MYLIKWVENGETKTFVAEGYIERLVLEEKLTDQNIKFTNELL